MTDVDSALKTALRHGLASRRPPIRLRGSDVDALLARAAHHRLVGLLAQAVADGAIVVDDDDGRRAIATASVHVAETTLVAEREMLRVAAALSDAHIEHRFLKGATFAHRYYAHAALRPFVDVDVLVHGASLAQAVDVFERRGCTRRFPELRPGFASRFGKSVTLLTPGGVEVDLHRTLAPGPFGLAASPAPLLERPGVPLEIGGTFVLALDADASFVHACVHACTTNPPRLAHLRDVRAVADSASPGGVASLAATLGLSACVEASLSAAEHELEWELPGDWSHAAIAPTARERRWLRLYRTPNRSFASDAAAGLWAIDGWRTKARYLHALVFRDARSRVRSGHVLTDVRRAVRGARRRRDA